LSESPSWRQRIPQALRERGARGAPS
jgi:hypothetical protein